MHCDKLLHLVDCDRLVDCSSRARLLTATVTYMTAYCRERIIFLDKSQSICISSLRRKSQITLYRDMCRTRSLTRSGTGIVRLYAIVVTIVPIPIFFAPRFIRRKKVLRILHLRTILLAEFLSECYRAGRAHLNTSSAGNTFFFIYMRNIRTSRHIRRIEKLRCPERIADIDIAIADSKNLLFAVYIRDLVNKSVLFALLEYLQRFFLRDVTATLVRLNNIVSHITDCYTPVMEIIRTTFIISHTRSSA